MLPNLTMKSYSRFICEYIERVLKTAKDQTLNLNQNEFFALYDILKTPHHGLSRECQNTLIYSSSLFLVSYSFKRN